MSTWLLIRVSQVRDLYGLLSTPSPFANIGLFVFTLQPFFQQSIKLLSCRLLHPRQYYDYRYRVLCRYLRVLVFLRLSWDGHLLLALMLRECCLNIVTYPIFEKIPYNFPGTWQGKARVAIIKNPLLYKLANFEQRRWCSMKVWSSRECLIISSL